MTSGAGGPFYLSANNLCNETYVEVTKVNDESGNQRWLFIPVPNKNDTYYAVVERPNKEGDDACPNLILKADEDCFENSVFLSDFDLL